jgi:bifunctional non-homologous end joining protein LigD
LVGARCRFAYAVFDVLALDGEEATHPPYVERRALLESLDVAGNFWFVPSVFDDGPARSRPYASRGSRGSRRSRARRRTGQARAAGSR